jgi:hypothetical protein
MGQSDDSDDRPLLTNVKGSEDVGSFNDLDDIPIGSVEFLHQAKAGAAMKKTNSSAAPAASAHVKAKGAKDKQKAKAKGQQSKAQAATADEVTKLKGKGEQAAVPPQAAKKPVRNKRPHKRQREEKSVDQDDVKFKAKVKVADIEPRAKGGRRAAAPAAGSMVVADISLPTTPDNTGPEQGVPTSPDPEGYAVQVPEVTWTEELLTVDKFDLDKFNIIDMPVEALLQINSLLPSAQHFPVGHEVTKNVIISVGPVGVVSVTISNEEQAKKIMEDYRELYKGSFVEAWKWRPGCPKHLLVDSKSSHMFDTNNLVHALLKNGVKLCNVFRYGDTVRHEALKEQKLYTVDLSSMLDEKFPPPRIKFDIAIVVDKGVLPGGEHCYVTLVGPDWVGSYAKNQRVQCGKMVSVYGMGGMYSTYGDRMCGSLKYDFARASDGTGVVRLPMNVEVGGQTMSEAGVAGACVYPESVHLLKVGQHILYMVI